MVSIAFTRNLVKLPCIAEAIKQPTQSIGIEDEMEHKYLLWGNDHSSSSNMTKYRGHAALHSNGDSLELKKPVRSKGKANEENAALALASFYDRPEIRHKSFLRYFCKPVIKK